MILTARSPSPTSNASPTTLVQLSRNASVISSSSSSSSSSSINLPATPTRERPPRTFSPPRLRKGSRDHSPDARKDDPLGAAVAIAAKPRPRMALPATGARLTDNGPATPRARGAPLRQLITRADFDFGEPVGEGSYSEVVCATHKASGKVYAIKVISKMHLIKEKKVKYATSERDALALLTSGGHPGVIQLYWTFQDGLSLYFVTSLEPNGNLQALVRKLGSLSLRCAQYYTAQIVDTVTWMHERGVVHRDVKPENILLDSAWRAKLADFGSAKLLQRGEDGAFVEDRETTHSFVGSAQYVSPELLLDQYKYACKSSDLYAIGCILFQLLTGQFLFHGNTEFLTFQKIKSGEHTPFPDWLDEPARDLIGRLLPLDPTERIGATPRSSTAELKAHPFFASPRKDVTAIHWSELWTSLAPRIEVGAVRKEPEDDDRPNWDDFSRDSQSGQETVEDTEEAAQEETETEQYEGAVAEVVQRVALARLNDNESPPVPRVPHRSGSTSQSSDGTVSSLDHANPPEIPLDQLSKFLGPGEAVTRAAQVSFRREVLGGLVRKDRPVILCLTATAGVSSAARLLALHATRKGWRQEAELALGRENTGADGTVIGIDGTPGDRTFTLRASSRTYTILTPDPQVAAQWITLLRDAITDARTRT